MASKTPVDKTRQKAVPVAVELPAAAIVADVPTAFVPTQSVTEKSPPGKPVTEQPVKAARPAVNKGPARDAAPKPAAPKPTPPIVIEATATPAKEEIKMDTTTTAPLNTAGATQFADKAKTMFTDATAKGTQAFADMNDFGKGNVEAIVESGKIAVRGIEALGQDAADYGRKQFEGATAAFKSLSSVKSPTDFFKLQSDYFRASFDSLVAQTSKNTETMLKLAGEVAQPIQNRVAVAVETVKIAA